MVATDMYLRASVRGKGKSKSASTKKKRSRVLEKSGRKGGIKSGGVVLKQGREKTSIPD